jgi:hypothetical protein
VRQPERIEMIVKETAKFENADIVRFSSCAYPSWCSRALSSSGAVCWSETSIRHLLKGMRTDL